MGYKLTVDGIKSRPKWDKPAPDGLPEGLGRIMYSITFENMYNDSASLEQIASQYYLIYHDSINKEELMLRLKQLLEMDLIRESKKWEY